MKEPKIKKVGCQNLFFLAYSYDLRDNQIIVVNNQAIAVNRQTIEVYSLKDPKIKEIRSQNLYIMKTNEALYEYLLAKLSVSSLLNH